MENENIERRDFLSRAFKAGISTAIVSGAAYYFYDGQGPRPPHLETKKQNKQKLVTIPDFSMAEHKNKMAIAHGKHRGKSVRKAMKVLGGMQAFIQKGDRVLIKVNAAFATPSMLGATTHPDLLAEVVKMCLEVGASSVAVTDNPINDPQSCFALSGIANAAEKSGAKLILPKKSYFQPTTIPGGKLIKNWPLFYHPLQNVDKVIGMTPVKHHQRSGASMTMKNWYGLLGGRRNIFHQNIHNIIKELAIMIKPTLVILDGTVTMMSNGPTGGSLNDLKKTNTLIVSTDQVAADAYGLTLLENHALLPYIEKARESGVGVSDYTSLNPIHLPE